MKRVLLLVGVAVVMSACGQSPTAPAAAKKAPANAASHDELVCQSGYVIAFDENGNPICVPDPNGGGNNSMSSSPKTGNSSSSSGGSTPPGH